MTETSSSKSGLARIALTLAASGACAGALGAQLSDDLDGLSDLALYDAACANCHGAGGRGLERALLGFEEEVPDFTDCDFAAREPDADWIAVAHEGGPVRGFSPMMPAFRGALTPEQLGRIMRYIRTLCTDPDWPRGELNLPRALITEKAYPEDEWVVEAGTNLEGEGAVGSTFVYEQRFGKGSQFEVSIPFGWREVPDPGGLARTSQWVGGLGDVAVRIRSFFPGRQDRRERQRRRCVALRAAPHRDRPARAGADL